MKKAGIVTFTYGDNFGQRFQNLAVQEILRLKGFEPVTFPQIPPKAYEPNCREKGQNFVKDILKGRLFPKMQRHKLFNEFDCRYITYYERAISPSSPPDIDMFDYFIAGSDQIWNPTYPEAANSTMFLTFAPCEKRIALAPSIAVSMIPVTMREEYSKYFEGFHQLSVREESGRNIINDLTGRNAEVLIDPTLYFDRDFWRQYAKPPKHKPNNPYVVSYILGDPETDKEIDDFCHRLSLKRVDLMRDKRCLGIGPSEFIYLVANADCVLTDSYHGTIFSILFERPFIRIPRANGEDMNSRFETLFKKLDIEEQDFTTKEIGIPKIKFESILNKVDFERQRFDAYLDMCFSADRC